MNSSSKVTQTYATSTQATGGAPTQTNKQKHKAPKFTSNAQ